MNKKKQTAELDDYEKEILEAFEKGQLKKSQEQTDFQTRTRDGGHLSIQQLTRIRKRDGCAI